jgi:endonuclease YncB( thermonuclease family)
MWFLLAHALACRPPLLANPPWLGANLVLVRLALVLLMLTVAHVAMAGQITGRVVGIADGDTLTVLDGTLRQTKVPWPRSTRLNSANPMAAAPSRHCQRWCSARKCE